MSMKRLILSACVAVALVHTPAAAAEERVCYPQDAGGVAIETESVTLYASAQQGAGGIVVELWRETNDLPGLQKRDTYCSDGSTIEADFRQGVLNAPDPRRL